MNKPARRYYRQCDDVPVRPDTLLIKHCALASVFWFYAITNIRYLVLSQQHI
jgi:hypothetical protein